jgi:hypothetical protein
MLKREFITADWSIICSLLTLLDDVGDIPVDDVSDVCVREWSHRRNNFGAQVSGLLSGDRLHKVFQIEPGDVAVAVSKQCLADLNLSIVVQGAVRRCAALCGLTACTLANA